MIEQQREPHVLLLTGVPGIGKTTIIRKLAMQLAPRSIAGFYTEEIREQGQRRGFRWIGFGGEQAVIAHVDFDPTYRVGKYGVDVMAIAGLVGASLRSSEAVDVYLIDEIGKMECLSPEFVKAVRGVLGSGTPLVATIAKKGGGFIDEVKGRDDVLIWEVGHANRDGLAQRIVHWLRQRERR